MIFFYPHIFGTLFIRTSSTFLFYLYYFQIQSNVQIDRDQIASYVASLQRPDGSFTGDKWGEVDTRFSYCAVSLLSVFVFQNFRMSRCPVVTNFKIPPDVRPSIEFFPIHTLQSSRLHRSCACAFWTASTVSTRHRPCRSLTSAETSMEDSEMCPEGRAMPARCSFVWEP